MELECLRREAVRMECELLRLQELKIQYTGDVCVRDESCTSIIPDTNVMKSFRHIKPRKVHKNFVWKEIAKRQLKERWRAYSENRELRERLVREYELGRHMQELLQKQQLSKCLAINDNSGSMLLRDDSDVFKEQLIQAENAFLRVDKVLQERRFTVFQSPYMGTSIEKDISGETFVMQSNMILPFNPTLVQKGFWSVLGSERIKDHCYEHHVTSKSDDVIAQSFGIHYTTDSVDGDFRCRYTLCRFLDGDRVVIVWVGLFEPVVFDGVPCCGVRCQQIGWIDLRKLHADSGTATLARHHSRLKVEADKNVHDKKMLLESLSGLVPPIAEKLSTVCGSILENVLVEEDWKVNGDVAV
ncbi:hypothetical protein PHMEG_00024665 [Phytophthora megakarya]|uniref:M96 mating-specific protein n=1 Tax=Phytophthora megakarya TaxID=4795 RepID=A0A225VFC8_9STRA|nr:hypothetical protein PHMEG_00024665 [Phytophthora megakarya]